MEPIDRGVLDGGRQVVGHVGHRVALGRRLALAPSAYVDDDGAARGEEAQHLVVVVGIVDHARREDNRQSACGGRRTVVEVTDAYAALLGEALLCHATLLLGTPQTQLGPRGDAPWSNGG